MPGHTAPAWPSAVSVTVRAASRDTSQRRPPWLPTAHDPSWQMITLEQDQGQSVSGVAAVTLLSGLSPAARQVGESALPGQVCLERSEVQGGRSSGFLCPFLLWALLWGPGDLGSWVSSTLSLWFGGRHSPVAPGRVTDWQSTPRCSMMTPRTEADLSTFRRERTGQSWPFPLSSDTALSLPS